MSKYFFQVERAGVHTTFQDLGRFNVQHLGICPGGWNIIGKTPTKLFEKNKKNPSLLYPGAQVKFKSISKKTLMVMESKHNE